MRRTRIAFVLLAWAALLPGAADRFFASAGVAALYPGESRFRELYGRVFASPELRVGYNFYRGFHACLGASFISATGVVPVVEAEAQARQAFLSLGAGWETRRQRRWQANLFAGLLLSAFREKAMGNTAAKSALGLAAGAGLRYFLNKRLFLETALGYAGARTSLASDYGEKRISLGGARLGVSLGCRF